MAERIIGIDISGETIKTVVVEKSFRNMEVVRLEARKISGNATEDEIAVTLKDMMGAIKYDADEDMVTTVLPARLLSSRTITVPLKKRSQILEILPYEIESSTPFSADDFVCDYVPVETSDDGTKILSAIALKNDLAQFLNIFKKAEISPDVVVPAPFAIYVAIDDDIAVPAGSFGVILETGHNSTGIIFLKNKTPMAFHFLSHNKNETAKKRANAISLELGVMLTAFERQGETAEISTVTMCGEFAESAELLQEIKKAVSIAITIAIPSGVQAPALIKNLDVELSSFAGVLGATYRMAGSRAKDSINLRTGEFEKKQKLTGHRGQNIITAFLVATLIITALTSGIMESVALDEKHKSLKKEIRAEFKKALPNIKNIVSERQQLKNAMSSIEAKTAEIGPALMETDPFLERLTDISKAAPADVKINIHEFVYEWEIIELAGQTVSYEKMEAFKKSIEALPWVKKITIKKTKAAVSSEEINFSFEIKLAV
ncbi:hypothetical protein MNBD_NITROSPINAE01-1556 [hydrothermal vent metagenome]|uniref:Type IV pilus biogenesis protein PilM n=1 Tax=hydrothermal vent metagenome TaxID=652676 RepID=A0A3B1BV63_9ZZZZ